MGPTTTRTPMARHTIILVQDIVNTPHPMGTLPSRMESKKVVSIARNNSILLLSRNDHQSFIRILENSLALIQPYQTISPLDNGFKISLNLLLFIVR